MSAVLQPGSSVSRYRIVSRLGAGGMGEVYLAQDETLGRSVALKVIPPERAGNADRLQRFIQEAKSASALNHPNIVTIHEIGRAEAGSPESAGDSATTGQVIHFIAMELVAGHTLRHLIHNEQTDLRTLLGYLAQAADGLARAHASGIVHRDIKPDNIMVTHDGLAKILDFGLAKLVAPSQPSPGATDAPTAAQGVTGEGVLVGTVSYMSPEQVQGRPADQRSDVFAFGAVLYEATTRRQPFTAETSVETLHRIFKEQPAPVQELNPAAPAMLRRLIHRCLAKNPERRLQSMKDLALELAEIVEEYETLSASETSGSGTTSAPVLARRLPRWTWATIGAGVIVVGLLVGLATRGLLGRGRGAAAEPGQRMQITRLTSGGVTRLAEISPDGRYLARMTYERDGYALRVTQVATGSDVLIVPATKTPFLGFKFTPDGEYLYFTRQEPNVLYASLHRVPILGGASPKLLHDVDCGVGFSPDGKRLAFIRGIPERNESALVLADAEGGDEIVLSLLGNNLDWQQSDPSWSPDGRRIVAARYDVRYPYEVQINVVEVDGGRLRPLGESWSNVVALAWHPDGRTVLVAGSRDQATHSNQLWAVSYPDGKVARITNDLSNYISVSLSKDGRSLVTVQSQTVADIWAAPVGDRQGVRALATAAQLKGHPHQITSSLPGAVLATVSDAHSTRIVSLPEGDGSPRVLYSSPDGIECLRQARSAGTIAFTVVRAGGFNCIWRMDADGGNPTQVTKGGDEWLGDISADGQRIWYCRAQQRGVWEVPAAGGESVQCGDSTLVGMPRLSPDGRFLVCVAIMFMNPGQIQARLELIPVDGGEPAWSRPWSVEEVGDISWTPDGTSISYCVNTGAVGNVWRLSLDGGPPEQVTDFEQDQLFGHAWSADGRTLFVKRGQRLSEAVLIQNYQ